MKELKAPSDGTPGISSGINFSKFAHGETEEFSSSKAEENRRAQITLQPTVKTPPATQPTKGTKDFKIDRVIDSNSKMIYFARNDKSISFDALLAIYGVKFSPPPSVELKGYVSHDEPASLAQGRVDAVKQTIEGSPCLLYTSPSPRDS